MTEKQEVIKLILDDKKKSNTYDRYPIRFLFMKLSQNSEEELIDLIKELNDWKKIPNVFIKKNPLYIKILEPNGEYQKQDGSIGTSYNVKKLLDIMEYGVTNSVAPKNSFCKLTHAP